MRNKLTIAVLSLVVGLAAATAQSFAQAPSGDSFSKYLFIFERSAAQIKQELAGNARHIASIRQEIEQGVDSIVLVGYASPEGDEARNMTLAKGRSAAVRDFLSSQTGLPLDKISIHDVGEDWEGFAAAVNATYNRPDREDVMRILSSDKSNAAKKEAFKKLDGGRTWQYLIRNQMTNIRRVEAISLKSSQPVIDIVDEVPYVEIEPVVIEFADLHVDLIDWFPACCDVVESEPIKPFVAVSTNLLYDAVTAFNLGVEVSLGRHFTVEADAIYNNMSFSGDRLLDIKVGNIGVNYYFNDKGPALKGWFVSSSVGGGQFNLQGKKSGRKGNMRYLNVGAGYAFQLGSEASHWRLKLAGGIGPVKAPYQYFEKGAAGNSFNMRDNTFAWGLPTNLEISINYLFQ